MKLVIKSGNTEFILENVELNNNPLTGSGTFYKGSKVKTIAAVDLEKVATVDDFVDQTCTENRLKQGLDKLKEKGLEQTSQNTGEFIKWIMQDILKEEIDLLSESGLTSKDISGKIAGKARDFYLKSIV